MSDALPSRRVSGRGGGFVVGDAIYGEDRGPVDDVGAEGGAVPQYAAGDAVLVDAEAERVGEVIALRRRHARLVIGVGRVAPDELVARALDALDRCRLSRRAHPLFEEARTVGGIDGVQRLRDIVEDRKSVVWGKGGSERVDI